jgi:hypothetical protein
MVSHLAQRVWRCVNPLRKISKDHFVQVRREAGTLPSSLKGLEDEAVPLAPYFVRRLAGQGGEKAVGDQLLLDQFRFLSCANEFGGNRWRRLVGSR